MKKSIFYIFLLVICFLLFVGCNFSKLEKEVSKFQKSQSSSKEKNDNDEKDDKASIPEELEGFTLKDQFEIGEVDDDELILCIYTDEENITNRVVIYADTGDDIDEMQDFDLELVFSDLLEWSFDDYDGDDHKELVLSWEDPIGWGTAVIRQTKKGYKVAYNDYDLGIGWKDIDDLDLKELIITKFDGGGYTYYMPKLYSVMYLEDDTYIESLDLTILQYQQAYRSAKEAFHKNESTKNLISFIDQCIMSGRTWEVRQLAQNYQVPAEAPFITDELMEGEDPESYMKNLADASIYKIEEYFEAKGESLRMFVFPYSDTQLLEEVDFTNLTQKDLVIARNEIYARHGIAFESDEEQYYFDGLPWYNQDPAYDGSLSDIEHKNLKLIEKFEE